MVLRLAAVSAVCAACLPFAVGPASAAATPVCKAGQKATAAHPCTKPVPVCKKGQTTSKAHPCTKPKTTAVSVPTPTAATKPLACPIVGATGVQGGAALGDKATGMLSIGCNFEASGLKIQMPGHSFASVTDNFAGEACSAAGDTITCKLNLLGQDQGIAAVGAWQDSIGFKFAATDEAATNTTSGTCGIAMSLTLTNAGATVFTKSTSTVCQA
jgi:hypothetical protein